MGGRLALMGLLCALLPGSAGATDGPLRIYADPVVAESGLMTYIAPRFTLKTRIKLEESDRAAAELHIAPGGTALMQDADGKVFGITQIGRRAEVARFADWLASDVGQRTILAYRQDGAQVFFAPKAEAVVESRPALEGDTVLGAQLAKRHCGRCHVVSAENRFAGIGSTPSFMALRTLPNWDARFAVFWTLNPHPSFTQVEGMTEPFPPDRPSPIAPILLSLEEAEAIAAFGATVPPADLGAEVQAQ